MEKRPTRAVIDTGAMKQNYKELRGLLSETTKVMAIVKANAYGHGDIEAAHVFEAAGTEYLGVAMVEEGLRLRDAGIGCPVVVLGGVWPGQIEEIFAHDLTPVVFDIEGARLINKFARGAGSVKDVHVKIDTGMHRLGLLPHEVAPFFNEFKTLTGLRLEAVLSHFSEAESEAREFTRAQLSLFLEGVEAIKAAGVDAGFVDMANSAAAVDYAQARLGLVRPGLMLYGAYPAQHYTGLVKLAPAMRLETRVLSIREIPEGAPVSYGRTFRAGRTSRIATLPIGYADGLPRRLSGAGHVLIRGHRAPIAGVVCMDLTMCDVTDIPGVEPGDGVVVMGSQGNEKITVEEIALAAGTISYEIFTNISARVPRVYV